MRKREKLDKSAIKNWSYFMKSVRINKKTKSYVHKHDLFFIYIFRKQKIITDYIN